MEPAEGNTLVKIAIYFELEEDDYLGFDDVDDAHDWYDRERGTLMEMICDAEDVTFQRIANVPRLRDLAGGGPQGG